MWRKSSEPNLFKQVKTLDELECPFCHGLVGQESCAGCRKVHPYLTCSRCHGNFKNPSYESGLECPHCHAQVIKEGGQTNMQTKLYLCDGCFGFVENTFFTGFSTCTGCKPPLHSCGSLLASNPTVDYWLCSGCGAKVPK
jgi:DNA-directed RNA polymerase subunit RPC12/RpoP